MTDIQAPFLERATQFLTQLLDKRKKELTKFGETSMASAMKLTIERLANDMPKTTDGMARFVIRHEMDFEYLIIHTRGHQNELLSAIVAEALDLLQNVKK